jgi:hypothetical protein
MWWGGPVNTALDYVTADGGVSVVAHTPIYTDYVAYDGSDLFLAVNDGIYRLVGGVPQLVGRLAMGQAYIGFVALDSTAIYFSAGQVSNAVVVGSVPKSGGPVRVLFTQGGYAEPIALDATHVYLVDLPGRALIRMNKDGTNPTTILTATSPEGILGVAADDQCIYWTAQGNGTTIPNTVRAMPK